MVRGHSCAFSPSWLFSGLLFEYYLAKEMVNDLSDAVAVNYKHTPGELPIALRHEVGVAKWESIILKLV